VNPLQQLPESKATNFAIEWLHQRGFAITRRNGDTRWLTPTELRDRHAPHLTPQALYIRLGHRSCPVFEARRGATGRLIELVPTPELIAWVSRGKQRGKMLERSAA